MTEMTLAATRREGRGKGVARKLRREGQVPGVVYGLAEPISIQLDERVFSRLVHTLHGGGRLITLELSQGDGGAAERKHVLLKEVQRKAVGSTVLHIDFHEVNVDKVVEVDVEVRPMGKASGEKLGGILQTVAHSLTVECLPSQIPGVIEVDVSALEIGHSLHVKDIPLPEGVKAIAPADETVFVVAAPRIEEAEVAPEAEEAAEAAAPGAAPEAPAGEKAEPKENED